MTTVHDTSTTVQFDTALRSLAAQATTRYAGEKARIDRGLVIALNHGVTLHADGTADVQSCSNAEVVYHVAHGTCDCPDFTRAPAGHCKHRFAVCLVKRATAQAAVAAELATIDRLSGLCATVLSDIQAARRLLASTTPEPTPAQGPVQAPPAAPAGPRYYATYAAPDGTDHQGIAQYVDGRVWLFVTAAGDRCFVADEALTLGGNVQIADTKRAEEEAAGGRAAIVCGYGK